MHYLASVDLDRAAFARRTKIVCTVGPSSQSVDVLCDLIKAGMNVARLNFSHGSYDYHLTSIRNIREAEKECYLLGGKIGIALDTKGPEIRTGNIEGSNLQGSVNLIEGETIYLTTDKAYENRCNESRVFVTHEGMPALMSKGQKIFIDDGLLCLEVMDKPSSTEICCKVITGGNLSSRKGVNLPDCNVDLPNLSAKDIEDIKFGVEKGVDFIFASFIRSAEAVNEIRTVLGERGDHIKIVSKLENEQALRNLKSIINASDGIMVARGDLGIEIPPEKVVAAQKKIITLCNLAGKPVICATQMLESMTNKPRATRAEVSDVANAVLDGADCIMLSGETAKGMYPVKCVELMNATARQAENCMFYKQQFLALTNSEEILPSENVTAIAAIEAAFKMNASIIIVLTSTGKSARVLSRYCPKSIIMAVTRIPTTVRALTVHRGVHPILIEDELVVSVKELLRNASCDDLKISRQTRIRQNTMNTEEWLMDIEKRVNIAVQVAKQSGYIKSGDAMVCVTGWRSGAGATNTVRIMYCP